MANKSALLIVNNTNRVNKAIKHLKIVDKYYVQISEIYTNLLRKLYDDGYTVAFVDHAFELIHDHEVPIKIIEIIDFGEEEDTVALDDYGEERVNDLCVTNRCHPPEIRSC